MCDHSHFAKGTVNMRVVFLGTGDFGVPVLRALLGAGHEVACVISQPDRPAGRGRTIKPTPIHTAADQHGLRHIQAENVNGLDHADTLARVDIGVVVAFGQKISGSVLAAVPRGCVNIHGSLLPRFRGAAPFQWAIIEGAELTGVTVFQLNERWDAGAVWGTRSTPIGDTETADELHDRLAELGAGLVVDTLAEIAAGTKTPVPQDTSLATRAPKLSKADSVVDWSRPAAEIARRINGLWSWPAAAAILETHAGKQERMQLARAQMVDADTHPTDEFPPGTFCDDLSIQSGRGRVRLLEVRPAGRKLMLFKAFANGRRLAPGARLLPVPA